MSKTIKLDGQPFRRVRAEVAGRDLDGEGPRVYINVKLCQFDFPPGDYEAGVDWPLVESFDYITTHEAMEFAQRLMAAANACLRTSPEPGYVGKHRAQPSETETRW